MGARIFLILAVLACSIGFFFLLRSSAEDLTMKTIEAEEKLYEIQSKVREEVSEKAETYTIYLDGEEVDNETVDIFLYDYSVDDSQKKIYLTRKVTANKSTKKSNSHTTIIPMPIVIP